MHPLFAKSDELSRQIIGAAIEVHRAMGPGLMESIYEKCLVCELQLRKITCAHQRMVRVNYKGFSFEESLRFDLMIEDCLLLELKCVERLLPVHKAQLLSYMKLLNVPLGLLMNFHEERLIDSISRMMLPGANHPAATGEIQ